MRLTSILIDICYDCRCGIRSLPANGHLDIDGTTDQLLGLRNVLDDLFRAATTRAAGVNPVAVTTLESSGNAISGLLVKCKNEVDELESALEQENNRKASNGPPWSLNMETVLSNLTLSTCALRGVIDGGRQYASYSLTSKSRY